MSAVCRDTRQPLIGRRRKRDSKKKKRGANAATRMLGAALRPDPEGWEHGTQPPAYQEYESPEPESNKNAGEGSSRLREEPSPD
jgi:hypothetical protein